MFSIIHEHYPILDSTQSVARKKTALLTAPHQWLVVTADEQTRGRGTHGRPWLSPPGNLYTTLVIPYPQKAALELPPLSCLPLVMALAVSEVLEGNGMHPAIKWPNDLLLKDKKVCGILCELQSLTEVKGYLALLVGIGLNVNLPQGRCDQMDQPVTSLYVETQKTHDLGEMLKQMVDSSHRCMESLKVGGFDMLLPEITRRLAWRGERVFITQENERGDHAFFGKLLGIHNTGELRVEAENGQVKRIAVGKIERVRSRDNTWTRE